MFSEQLFNLILRLGLLTGFQGLTHYSFVSLQHVQKADLHIICFIACCSLFLKKRNI